MKSANATKEREWQMIIAAQDNEIRREEKDLADMEREQTRIDELLERINAPTKEAVQLLAQRDQATKKLEEERFDRSALFATQARLGTGITAVTKMLEYTQFQLIEEQKYAAENGEDRPGSVDFEKINADLEGKKATLEEALAANTDAAKHFVAFSESSKKNILWWIESAKRPETRAKRIAETLGISTLTVRKHIANVYEKLQVNSKAQIMTLAHQYKWFE